ncbi:MAG TPA: hypothetical protein VMB52_06955 [Verrucomicrobiae bacterium]|nr:hypothetical protein [Verrucomicrobiae bacterium]
MVEEPTRVKAATIFRKAAAYIRKYGWQVEGMSEDGKPRSSMGALASAYPKKTWEKDLSSLMYDSLNSELQGISLTEFDHKVPNGTAVAKLFERTAVHLAR